MREQRLALERLIYIASFGHVRRYTCADWDWGFHERASKVQIAEDALQMTVH